MFRRHIMNMNWQKPVNNKKMKTLADDHAAGKAWNERRSQSEKEGIEKFWQRREAYRNNALMKELGWNKYCRQKEENKNTKVK